MKALLTRDYNIVLDTEREKYDFITAAVSAGAKVTDVSGYGPRYHVSIEATADQVLLINKTWYSPALHDLTADQVRRAWRSGELSMGQVVTWQERHGEVI